MARTDLETPIPLHEKPYLTGQEGARLLGMDYEAFCTLLRTGEIAACRRGPSWWVHRFDIDEWFRGKAREEQRERRAPLPGKRRTHA